MKQRVFEWLKSQGLCPSMDDNAIHFKYQMKNFIYFADDDDQNFFQLCLPGIFDWNDENIFAVLKAMNEVNIGRKVIKAGTIGDSVWLFFEVLLDESPEFDDIIPRGMQMLLGSQDCFYEKLNEM
jgi:hypothetical protein